MPALVIFDCDGVLIDSEIMFCGGSHCPGDHADRLIAAGCSEVFARMPDLGAFLWGDACA